MYGCSRRIQKSKWHLLHGRERTPDVDDGPMARCPVRSYRRGEDASEMRMRGRGIVVNMNVWDWRRGV